MIPSIGTVDLLVILSVPSAAILTWLLIEVRIGIRDHLEGKAPNFWRTKLGDEIFISIKILVPSAVLLFVLDYFGIMSISSLNLGSGIAGLVVVSILVACANIWVIKRYRLARVGDVIEDLETGRKGIVTDISFLYTELVTFNYEKFRILNLKIRSADILNYMKQSRARRVYLDVLITYESDVEQAQATLEQIIDQNDSVLNPDDIRKVDLKQGFTENNDGTAVKVGSRGTTIPFTPDSRIKEFGDSGILLRTYFWVKEPCKLSALKSQLREDVIHKFEELDVEFAYPHTELLLKEGSNTVSIDLGILE